MKLLPLLLLIFSANFSFGQISINSIKNSTPEEHYLIEGLFSFDYDGTIHQIKLSSKDGVYTEYDQNGIQLGEGKFIRNSGNYVLRPQTVSTYSLVNDLIQFDLINRVGDNINIIVMISDSMSEELQLIKL